MPGGHKYAGPPHRLERYREIVERQPDAEVKGAKNPYTSLNGWMSSFLDADGEVCLRASPDDLDSLTADHGATTVEQYGKKMPEFAVVPRSIVDDDAQIDAWFARSWSYTATKPPK